MMPSLAHTLKERFGSGPVADSLHLLRREFQWVGFFSMVSNVLMLTPTLYMLHIFHRVLISHSPGTLIMVSVMTLFFFLVMATAERLRAMLLVRISARLDRSLGSQVFHASLPAQLRQGAGSPGEGFSDLTQLRQFLTGIGVFALFDLPWTPIYIIVSFLLHPLLGAVSLVFVMFQCGLAYTSHLVTSPRIIRAGDASARANRFLVAKLRNVEVVEALGMRGNLRNRWESRYLENSSLQRQAVSAASWQQSLARALAYSQQSLVLALGGLLVLRGELSPGAMIAANLLVARALSPVQTIVSSWKGLVQARESYIRLSALLQHAKVNVKWEWPRPPHGELEIRDVVARATGRQRPILQGVTATVKAGQVVTIIGPSAAGKSTLAKILTGVWPDWTGDIMLDGVPIQNWDPQRLGAFVGYLPQDVELLEGTIAENISRFGPLDAEKVIAAARLAGVHEVVLRLPAGYDTPVGQAGMLLSGGHRQRVGLARALYGNPALIVLDEPNANLDEAGELALQEAIRQLKKDGRTVIVISHRMRVVAVADTVWQLQEGRLVDVFEAGRFLDMLRSGGRGAGALISASRAM